MLQSAVLQAVTAHWRLRAHRRNPAGIRRIPAGRGAPGRRGQAPGLVSRSSRKQALLVRGSTESHLRQVGVALGRFQRRLPLLVVRRRLLRGRLCRSAHAVSLLPRLEERKLSSHQWRGLQRERNGKQQELQIQSCRNQTRNADVPGSPGLAPPRTSPPAPVQEFCHISCDCVSMSGYLCQVGTRTNLFGYCLLAVYSRFQVATLSLRGSHSCNLKRFPHEAPFGKHLASGVERLAARALAVQL